MKKIILGQLYNILARNKKGFTLVELIIVITILAILTTIAFISFQNYSGNARDSNRLSTIKNIETGLELFTLKTSQFPTPEDTKTYTGGTDGKSQINQGIIGESVVKIISLSHIPLDPKDKTNYVYSTFGNSNKYYQVGINSENNELSFVPQVYTSSKSSIVKGNYRFDPTLPSLILVENEALINSGIFSPDVCFVMDNGNNNLNDCREKKSEMILKNYDNSLVGYWDMETLTGNLLKDLSGNSGDGNFIALGMNNAVITTETQIYNSGVLQNILPNEPQKINGIVGGAFAFDGGGYFTINDDKKIFQNLNYGNSITMSAIIKDIGVVDDTLGCEQGLSYQTYAFSAYRYNLGHSVGNMYALPSGKGTFLAGYKVNYFGNEYHLYTFTKNEYSTSFYIDGKKIDSRSINIYADGLTAYPFVGPFIGASKHCAGSSNLNRFIGEIDEVKIYNRALSDEEIFEQAKVAGF